MTGAEICPSIFWIMKMRPWRKACAQAQCKEQAILLLKLCAAFWGISNAKCEIKSIFLETDGKFQSTGNRTEKISTFHLVLGGYQLEVGTWDCDCCSAGGLGQVAIGQMSLLQTHRSSWQPG